jgi:DNA-binding response OmpR family regulator
MQESTLVKPRLLALDDNMPLAELIARVATRCGYEARAIDDVRSLMKLLPEWRPDVITLDLSMPGEDGMTVLTLLEEYRYEGTIVIVSGHDDWLRQVAVRLAVGRGLKVAQDLQKPIDVAVLSRIIANLHQPATAGA